MSFGTATLEAGVWKVRCEPHVRSRIKRVFPRIPQHASDVIEIRHTPENARELEWFIQRFPLEVNPAASLALLADEHRDTEIRVAEMLAARAELQDFDLVLPPREYQRFAANLLRVRGGLLLADDLGLGKTVSAICSMARAENLPCLVVCPTHLPRQWQKEIQRFAPGLRTHILSKGTPYPLVKKRAGDDLFPDTLPDVIISNYHKLRGWAETLAGVVRYVVFDEVQQLRSPDTLIYSAARLVSRAAKTRIGLSATPFYNYGSEIYWVLDALLESCLGDYGEFTREWCSGLTSSGGSKLADSKVFGAYLRREGIMLRRTRADVGRELPELSRIEHLVDHDPDALDQVKGNAVALAKIILSSNEAFRGQKMNAAGEFDAQMRHATGVAKAPYVAEFVQMIASNDERVVLFGWHHDVYAIWREALRDLGVVQFTGTESPTQKAAAIERFRSGEAKILIMSLRSGAGVDGLQGVCRTVVFGELDWSPGVIEQCIGRVHRDGQDEPCTAYFMVAEDGADPIMAQVLGVKKEQIEGVRNPNDPLVERIDTGENNLRRLASEFLARRGELQEDAA